MSFKLLFFCVSKKNLIISIQDGWLRDTMWPIKNLSQEIRLVFIGNLHASEGNYGDFSTRVGISPNYFTKWPGPKYRPIIEVI